MKVLLEQISLIMHGIVAEDAKSSDFMEGLRGSDGIFSKFRNIMDDWAMEKLGCVETNFEVYGCLVRTCLTGRFAGQPDES